jgi:hypothetical protein
MTTSSTLATVLLETGADGRARFRDDRLALHETRPQLYLSEVLPAGGWQLRESPPGYRLGFHCTVTPQWIIVVRGALEIALPDGTSRVFRAGDFLYANDKLPPGATFDPALHGHASRQVGSEAVVTVMVKG